jgi:hypothetical protein
VFRLIFLGEKIGFKRNYLKRQGQDSGMAGLARWKKWITSLGQDEKKVD